MKARYVYLADVGLEITVKGDEPWADLTEVGARKEYRYSSFPPSRHEDPILFGERAPTVRNWCEAGNVTVTGIDLIKAETQYLELGIAVIITGEKEGERNEIVSIVYSGRYYIEPV